MKLASIFTDNAVLQRERFVPVWGETQPLTKVFASIAGISSQARAGADGRFLLRLPPLPAGGPYELTLKTESGEALTLKNILVGEVWLASGQSNMEYQLNSDWAAFDSIEAKKNALSRKQEKEFRDTIGNAGMIRCFAVPRLASASRETTINSAWQVINPETAGDYTAVGMWFAKSLQEKIKVPVGIISSNWGGTIAEAWTSRAGLLRNPLTAEMVAVQDRTYLKDEAWPLTTQGREKSFFENNSKVDSGNSGFAKGWAEPDFSDAEWERMRIPGDWIRQEIAVNGAVWVRKEVDIPESWAGKEIFLRLGGVDKQDVTYFNGKEVGRTGKDFETEHWNMPRAYRVPGELVKAGRNVIAVRAYSFAYDGGFNGIETLYRLELVETKETIAINGVWKATKEYEIGRIGAGGVAGWGANNPNTPSILFDAMINPLLPYALRGVIWYQGESNAHTVADSLTYREKLGNMISDWRYHFAQGDFPFIQVELANFRTKASFDAQSAWALLREAQHGVCRDLANVYLASAIDIGDANDIHPLDKKTVGQRLMQNALHEVYHDAAATPAGPELVGFAHEGNKIRLKFKNAERLHFRGGAAKGFFIAGTPRHFRPADKVEIEGDSILVSCEKMDTPLSVRYNWSDNPDGNLYNAAELPCGTFRTDNWPDAIHAGGN